MMLVLLIMKDLFRLLFCDSSRTGGEGVVSFAVVFGFRGTNMYSLFTEVRRNSGCAVP